jgi:hypothetical protein
LGFQIATVNLLISASILKVIYYFEMRKNQIFGHCEKHYSFYGKVFNCKKTRNPSPSTVNIRNPDLPIFEWPFSGRFLSLVIEYLNNGVPFENRTENYLLA